MNINRFSIIYGLIGLLAFSCDPPTNETAYKESDSVSVESDKEVILEGTPSTWNTYDGTIPCADCSGIKMELRLESKPEKAEREYELTETYLDTPDGDRTFESSGKYEVSYGLKEEPSVLLIVLLDSNQTPVKAFVQESNGDLTLLDHGRNRISSELNYTLSKK